MPAAELLEVRSDAQGVSFAVRVSPRASRSAVSGVHGSALKVTLAAPPVDGEANEELCLLLSRVLAVPRRAVQITHGLRGKSKTVHVQGVNEDTVRELAAAHTKARALAPGKARKREAARGMKGG